MWWSGRFVSALEDFDDTHGSATRGTEQPVGRSGVVSVVVGVLRGFDAEELSGFDQVFGALPVGKQAVVSNAMEPVG